MADDPIFILGTERSGSNLLRLILDNHPRIAVPHPPHIVRFFRPLEASYGDLRQDGPFRNLVRDVLTLVRLHIHPWKRLPDEERVLREARPRDSFGIHAAVYEQYREGEGKARWGCKSTFMIAEVPAILERFPMTKLVWLVRDPRDVAASSRLSVFSTFHPYHTALLWREQQSVGLRWRNSLPRHTLHLLHYEKLVTSPEEELHRLCAFLEEDFDPKMQQHQQSQEARRSASLAESWGKTSEPIGKDRVGSWRGALTHEEAGLVEGVCGDLMETLGYPRETPPSPPPGPLQRWRFVLEETRLRLLVEARSWRKDRNVTRRWEREAWLASVRMRAKLRSLGRRA